MEENKTQIQKEHQAYIKSITIKPNDWLNENTSYGYSCGDCKVDEGELHQVGCDHEKCPICNNGQQLISCKKHDWKDLTDKQRIPCSKEELK